MTDPFSIAVGVFGLSSLAVKLITSISSYVDSVRGARADVQALSVGTSAVYTVLGRLKLELDRDSDAEGHLTEGSRDAARRVLEHCKGTLLGLERMVEKAQVVNVESGMERMVKTVRWKFKEAEIGRFKERLRDDKVNLKMVLQVLSREQDDKVVSMLEEISQRMSDLSQERERVKETFGVVEQGDSRASITILDRRGEPLQGEPERHGSVPPSKSIFSSQEWKLLEETKAPRAWFIRRLEFKIHKQASPTKKLSLDGQNDNIQLNLRRSKRLELWFSLGETVKTEVQGWFNEHTESNTISTSAAVLSYLGIGRPFIGSYSISFWDVRKHGEDTVLLVPSGSRLDFFLFEEIKVQFKNTGDADEFLNLCSLVQKEQSYCWKKVASLFSFSMEIDLEDETQLTQAAIEEEALGRRSPNEAWHHIEPFFLESWYSTGPGNVLHQASEANAVPQNQDADAPMMVGTNMTLGEMMGRYSIHDLLNN